MSQMNKISIMYTDHRGFFYLIPFGIIPSGIILLTEGYLHALTKISHPIYSSEDRGKNLRR